MNATADQLRPKHGLPSELVTVKRPAPPKSAAYFHCVLDEWEEQSGKSKDMFRDAAAVDVPREVIDPARKRLAGKMRKGRG